MMMRVVESIFCVKIKCSGSLTKQRSQRGDANVFYKYTREKVKLFNVKEMLLQARTDIDCQRNKLKLVLGKKMSICCSSEAVEEPSSKANREEWEAFNFIWLPNTRKMESSDAPELFVTTEGCRFCSQSCFPYFSTADMEFSLISC